MDTCKETRQYRLLPQKQTRTGRPVVVGTETDSGVTPTHQDGAENAQNEADREAPHPRPPGQRGRLIGSLQRCHQHHHHHHCLHRFNVNIENTTPLVSHGLPH